MAALAENNHEESYQCSSGNIKIVNMNQEWYNQGVEDIRDVEFPMLKGMLDLPRMYLWSPR
jgi:hypothetical protein